MEKPVFVLITVTLIVIYYLPGAGISLFRGLSSPLIRSYLTKTLPVEDIAKVFAFMCALEGMCPLLATALYNTLYAGTISVFPGAVYILSASICGVSFILVR